jgi:hypothetical protein
MVARNVDRTLGALTAIVVAAVEGVVLWALELDLERLMGLHFEAPMPPFVVLVVPAAGAVGWLLGPAVLRSSRRGLVALLVVTAVMAEVVGAAEVAAIAFAAPLMTQPMDATHLIDFVFAILVIPILGSILYAPLILPITTAAAAGWIVVLRALGQESRRRTVVA